MTELLSNRNISLLTRKSNFSLWTTFFWVEAGSRCWDSIAFSLHHELFRTRKLGGSSTAAAASCVAE